MSEAYPGGRHGTQPAPPEQLRAIEAVGAALVGKGTGQFSVCMPDGLHDVSVDGREQLLGGAHATFQYYLCVLDVQSGATCVEWRLGHDIVTDDRFVERVDLGLLQQDVDQVFGRNRRTGGKALAFALDILINNAMNGVNITDAAAAQTLGDLLIATLETGVLWETHADA